MLLSWAIRFVLCQGTGHRGSCCAGGQGSGPQMQLISAFCLPSTVPRATPTCWAWPNLKGWLVGVGAGQGPLDLSLPEVVGTRSVADQALSASEALRKDSWLRQPGGDRAHSRHASRTAPPLLSTGTEARRRLCPGPGGGCCRQRGSLAGLPRGPASRKPALG